MNPSNIFASLPQNLEIELFEDIIHSQNVRIERIVSKGHISPKIGWYDQDENEWVMVVKGKASLEFEDAPSCVLSTGDYINIPARVKHKVAWTDPNKITIWLAVFYK
ncbi:cupin 2 domain-containing protein [Candidatus Nitrosoglobus terrae]|uniref:Cupin 2 domain-containing protein n=1 Tax=Candidatus Nitrosoglobus terrae TaxID=1630141 RepID=A0A1Q2SKZ4_9GAMM|nr:cupin domain-containing protein [Candidatus Nitrosoglobus terrae]BAW79816.1 cupin 2 domain-containing protein [Candidatus Nitrosoglobus terrae]